MVINIDHSGNAKNSELAGNRADEQPFVTAQKIKPPAAMIKLPKRTSLVSQTADALRQGITAGEWTDVLPGERLLAQELQVSRPTVRAALSILEREGMLKSARGIGRRIGIHREAETPVQKESVVVLSAVPAHLMPPASLFYLNELRNALQSARLRLDIVVEPALIRQNPRQALSRLTARTDVLCWVLTAPSEAVQKWFGDRALPVLAAGSCAENVRLPFLDLDYRAVCRHAAGIFLRNGHERLCLFLAESPAEADRLSERGFLEGIERFGRGKAHGTVQRHDGTREGICRKLDDLLHAAEPPTAILGCRPLHVLTAVTHLANRGLLPPNGRGPSFISRDSDTFLRHVTPEISRYTFRRRSFAKRLSRLTLQLANNRSLPPHPFLLMPEYLPGQTVRKA